MDAGDGWTAVWVSVMPLNRTLKNCQSEFLLGVLATPCGLWELSFPTRDWTHVSCSWKCRVLTTGPPGKFQSEFPVMYILPQFKNYVKQTQSTNLLTWMCFCRNLENAGKRKAMSWALKTLKVIKILENGYKTFFFLLLKIYLIGG